MNVANTGRRTPASAGNFFKFSRHLRAIPRFFAAQGPVGRPLNDRNTRHEVCAARVDNVNFAGQFGRQFARRKFTLDM